ncbi:MAG: BamA/TamA family outer membrane protein [Fibrobacter sp.]|nr:BamA/TamA family outer membrane protein [Fibrobacter sp.]
MFFNIWKNGHLKCLGAAILLALVSLHAETVADRKETGSCVDGMVLSRIELDGLEQTNPRVVQRELIHRPGEKFSAEKYSAERRRLQDLDLFTEIEADCRTDSASSSAVLTYRLKEIFRWIPAPAGKKTDRDGLMVGLALANLNILGEDIRAEVQYRTALDPFLENNEYAFYASSPYLFGIPLGWNFEFLRTDSWDDLRRFNDASWLLDLDLDLNVTEHLSLLLSGAYRYIEDGPGHLPEVGLGFAFDFRDAALDTRKGVYLEYMLTHVGAGHYRKDSEHLGGERYWELLADVRGYYSLGRFVTGATALARYRAGDVERYDYLYHGGANTFRGHEADSLSLGKNELLLTLEERFVLRERKAASLWGINFFYGLQLVAGLDGSLLWDKGRPGWDNYEGAVYGGLHLVIPALDRVRFEVGYSPDRKEPVFYFGLFDKTTSARWRNR